jgi:hypothetical protein
MAKKVYVTFASVVAVISALAFSGLASTMAQRKQHQQRNQNTAAEHVRRRAVKARKRVRRRTVSYVCPMHSDVRSRSRGECPKCGMELVVE